MGTSSDTKDVAVIEFGLTPEQLRNMTVAEYLNYMGLPEEIDEFNNRDPIGEITGIPLDHRLRRAMFHKFKDDLVFKALLRKKKRRGKRRDHAWEVRVLHLIAHKMSALFHLTETH